MELQEFKSAQSEVHSETVADIVKVPQISRLLSAACVSAPISLSDIILGECSSFTHTYTESTSHHAILSPNYYKASGINNESDGLRQSNLLLEMVFQSNAQCSYKSDLKHFLIDGPNRAGMSIASARSPSTNFYSAVASNLNCQKKPYCSTKMQSLFLWSVALSEGNRAVFSGVSTSSRAAYLICRHIKEKVICNKFLMFNNTHHAISWDKECKSSILSKNDYHVFDKMSFINEDLLIGLDQNGKLYSILPHSDIFEHKPEFHQLAFKGSEGSFVNHFALDTYDRHKILILDNQDDFYVGRITAQKLVLKKIMNLNDLLIKLKTQTVQPSRVRAIRFAGNTCYFVFFLNQNQDFFVRVELISKQLSIEDKKDIIKKSIKKFAQQS